MKALLRPVLILSLIYSGIPGFGSPAAPQNPVANIAALNLVVIEGQGEVNNIKQRTARDLIVEVDDENHKPVSEAALTFLLPTAGAGATFAGGLAILKLTTDKNGRATARIEPNDKPGKFEITVTAAFAGLVATAIITETNAMVAAASTGAAAASTGATIAHASTTVTVLGSIAAGGAALGAVLPTALTRGAPAASTR